MASPISFRIFTHSLPHTLRAISVVAFLLGFIPLFVVGLASKRVNPAIGILPLFISASYSALLLSIERTCGCRAAGLTGTPIHIVCDLLCGIGLLLCLVLTWALFPKGYWSESNTGMFMFGTYATNFLIMNL
jgi:hypothetical protein